MTDRPIIFSGPMVRALLDGRKVMTRRLAASPLRKCQPGDRLYVRENWRADDFAPDDAGCTIYMADAPADALRETKGVIKWRPCIHMPRTRSRLTLIVTATKVERLQDISEANAHDEGAMIEYGEGANISERRAFELIWRHLHGVDNWNANPEVVALSFRVEKNNIDALAVAA
jgi:hypothetical protein